MLEVLIVGAGPAGLTLACDLSRRGVECRVIDRSPELFVGSRAKGLQPRTQEVFDDLGVIGAVRAGGAVFPSFRCYDGAQVIWERTVYEMLGVPPLPSAPTVPYPDIWLIPQWRTDRILAERFRELGGTIELGIELTGFTQAADRVDAATTAGPIRARYLVGCDGGRSTVRKTLGVGFAGETFETERTLIGDVRAEGLDGMFCHLFTRGAELAQRFSLWNLPDSPYYQFVASMAAGEVPALTLNSVRALLEHRSGRSDVRLHDLRWISLYQVHVRLAQRYRVNRVLLAGDAAHVHSSASGQGLNTSVQDAYNLGWKLAGVLAGAPDALLDTYQAERQPVAAEVLGLSTVLHQRDFRSSSAAAPALHQLDISYRDGGLAVDDRSAPGQLRAGDRAPDGMIDATTRLFDLFRGPQFTLLGFGQVPSDPGCGMPVTPLSACAGYDVDNGTFVLIRPDGHIGAISTTPHTIRSYLSHYHLDP